MNNDVKKNIGLSPDVADFLRDQCRQISMMANNVQAGTFEFDALIDAGSGIQEILEQYGEWKPEDGRVGLKI